MTILITGGAGFIGANLARVLVAQGKAVRVLDDLSTGRADNLGALDVDLMIGNILDEDLLDKAMIGVDSVVHLAARGSVPRSVNDPMTTHRINASGSITVLDAIRRAGVGHVIVASSSSVYGASPVQPRREDLVTLPLSPYAASKLAMEAYALAFAHCYALDALVFRFFNVYGPLQRRAHDYAAVVPAFVDAALRGTALPVHGDGTQTRDFTNVDAVVAALADAIERRVVWPEPVNLAFGERVSLLTLIEELEALIGRPLERESLAPRAGDVSDSQADSTRLRALFPQLGSVSLREGLAATVAWYETTL